MTLGTTTRSAKETWLEGKNDDSSLTLSGIYLTWNLKSTRPASYVLAGNYQILSPESMIAGMEYLLALTQDSSGNRSVNWGTAFEWDNDAEPELCSRPGATTLFKFYCDGTKMLGRKVFSPPQ